MATGIESAPAYELAPYKELSNDELARRIESVRKDLGPQLVILGHHYQQDEVIAHSDFRGDSLRLSQVAAASAECRRSSAQSSTAAALLDVQTIPPCRPQKALSEAAELM